MDIDENRLYTTKEYSSFFGISEVTAKRHVASGAIPSVKIGGTRRIPGIHFAELVQVKFKRRERPTAKGGCELTYEGKAHLEELAKSIPPAALKVERTYGRRRHNQLIQGDNLHILRALAEDEQFREKVDLIYIDPPFGTGQDFIGYNDYSYSDRLTNAEFLEFLRLRLHLLKSLLRSSGSIYVHIDVKIGHYVKVLMDEVFGEENFRNEITRIKCNPKNFDRKAYGNIKDVIFFYSKSHPGKNDYLRWNDYRVPLSEEEIARQFPKIDSRGRRYATTPLHAKGETKNGPTGKAWKGLKPPKGRHWRYAPTELTRLDEAGLIEWSATGNPRKIIYAHENAGRKIQDVWDFKDPGYEKARYPTEKNIDLLKQIVHMSSREGDTVLDCFCGSGTTLVAAQMLRRSWIGIDQNPDAIKTAGERLSELGSSFTISRTK